MRLLVTRPEPNAERTAAVLRARGHDVVAAPILRIETLADAALGHGPWAAILLTSTNAASAIARHPRRDDEWPEIHNRRWIRTDRTPGVGRGHRTSLSRPLRIPDYSMASLG